MLTFKKSVIVLCFTQMRQKLGQVKSPLMVDT